MGVAAVPKADFSLALTENRNLRFFVVFILYVTQGLPFGLFYYAVPAWLAQNGVSAGGIGSVLALTTLPWSLKLINGVVMDRFALLAMGRRRPWLIIGQIGIVLGFCALAWVNPGAQQIALIGALAFTISGSATIQDVAIDGMAVDVIPESEFGRANGFMFGGQAIGYAIGSALSGYLIAFHGLPAASLALAALVAAAGLLVIVVRERPGERMLPWTAGVASTVSIDRHLGALWPILRSLFAAMYQRDTLLILPAIFATGAAYGLFAGFAPLIATHVLGWGDDIYANWSGQANLVAGLSGALMFGFLAERWGARRMFGISCLLMAIAAAAMIALQQSWTVPIVLIVAIFGFTGLQTLQNVTGSAVAMRCCLPAVAATQFSLFMAVSNLGNSLAGASLGSLDRLGGISAMVVALIGVCVVGAAFTFAARVGR